MTTEKLHKFKELCRDLLRQGIKPTPTEFARRGWGYTSQGKNQPTIWHQTTWQWDKDKKRVIEVPGHTEPRPPIDHPGSGCTWVSGKYTQARREVLLEFGWRFVTWETDDPYTSNGTWVAP